MASGVQIRGVSGGSHPLPYIKRGKHGIQLIVKGSPFLMLGGELHNSSLSSARFMSEVWPAMKAQSINTLLGSVTWEMIEPVEGKFEFSELDKVIQGAREHSMHLVLLWFGTYKNGLSTYVPSWIKRDATRFPRVHILDENGAKRTVEMISPLSEECCKADSKAFGMLMQHLREIDSEHNTVIMVQVENETGLLGDSRDRSSIAEEEFKKGISTALVEYLSSPSTALHPRFKQRFQDRLPPADQARAMSYSWESIFGPGHAADEVFMAHIISTYVGRVAAAGRAEYNIPLYANAWLNMDDPTAISIGDLPTDLAMLPVIVGGGGAPGRYPSGGPCPHVLDVWRFNTPALDFLAPDLYFHDYERVCQDYTGHTDNALFIPEQRRDGNGSRRIWLAFATYGALGTAPFGIDTGAETVGREYKLLSQVHDILVSSRPAQRMGFYFDELSDKGPPTGKEKWTRTFSDLEVTIERAFVFGKPGPGGGMIIQLGDLDSARFLVVGRGFKASFNCLRPGTTFTGILNTWEKEFDPETKTLRTLRTFNGDETRGGKIFNMPNDNPDYGGFPVAVTVPARTCIAEIEAYWISEDPTEI
jgi:hypothetical protein